MALPKIKFKILNGKKYDDFELLEALNKISLITVKAVHTKNNLCTITLDSEDQNLASP